MNLKGKIAIITGASVGYGVGIAEVLKKEGCIVWITGRRENKLKKAAKRLNVKYFVGDVTKPKDWDELVKSVISSDKKIDILINNAGAGIAVKPLENQTDEEIKQSIDTNLTGCIYGTKRVIPLMKKQGGGNIIFISSVCAQHAWPTFSVYSAAKAGTESLAKCLHNELREDNIHITTLMPSWGDTEFAKAADLKGFSADIKKKVAKPAEIGQLVVSICKFPEHLAMPFVRIQPMIQEINPM